jgi:molybdopterin-guanine dinucleotide biosynthesis adapter protein
VTGYRIPVVSIVGTSNTGKTTLIEGIIPKLVAMGLKVATIKHHFGGFDIDIPGKDSYRHKQAGAATTIITAPGKIALVADLRGDLSLAEVMSRYVRDVDILIAEGYKGEPVAKIEVYRKKTTEGPVCLNDPNLLALVTDEEITASVPVFKADDVAGVTALIVSRLLDRKGYKRQIGDR